MTETETEPRSFETSPRYGTTAGGNYLVRVIVRSLFPAKEGFFDLRSGTVTLEVQMRTSRAGMWATPDGWDKKLLLKVSENFVWNKCPLGAFAQIARWLEMELYLNGYLNTDLQAVLLGMSASDYRDTFDKNFDGKNIRPYSLDELEKRLEQ